MPHGRHAGRQPAGPEDHQPHPQRTDPVRHVQGSAGGCHEPGPADARLQGPDSCGGVRCGGWIWGGACRAGWGAGLPVVSHTLMGCSPFLWKRKGAKETGRPWASGRQGVAPPAAPPFVRLVDFGGRSPTPLSSPPSGRGRHQYKPTQDHGPAVGWPPQNPAFRWAC